MGKFSHIQSLEEKHTHARQALEHYRESVKTQREQEQHRHDHQVQQLQAELRLSHQALSVKQQECTTLKAQTQQQSAELQHATQSVSKIEQQLLGIQNSQQQTEQKLYRKDTELNRLQKQHEDLQQQYAEAAAKVAGCKKKSKPGCRKKRLYPRRSVPSSNSGRHSLQSTPFRRQPNMPKAKTLLWSMRIMPYMIALARSSAA